MIFANSRYEDADLVYAVTSDGEKRRVVEIPQYYGLFFSARKHVVEEDERLDQIAARYYAEPEMWWIIAVANPELFYPEDVPAGTVLRIPDAPAVL